MQTILSKYSAYLVATLSFSSTPQIVSDTIGPLEKSEPWKWAVILWLISGWPHSFLWTAMASSSSSGFPVSTIQQSCNTQPLLSSSLQSGQWLDNADRAGSVGKSPHDKNRPAHMRFFCHSYQIGNPFTSCASNNVLRLPSTRSEGKNHLT